MDPVSQGVVGAAASQLVSSRREKVEAAGIGFLAGLAADIDVIFRSSVDPLLFLEYHRHFTHALVFIPVGALFCAWAYMGLQRLFKRNSDRSLGFKRVYLFSFAGYATHALLDACTTYGTQLFLPFSNTRVAWNNVSVVDPLFTIPLAVLVIFAIIKRSDRMAKMAVIYAISYLLLGIFQQHRAVDAATELAESRGHIPQKLGLKPSFANLLVWKSVYQYQSLYYVDAVRVGLSAKIYEGVSTEVLSVIDQFPWLGEDFQQAQDIERFRWFSNDHLGVDPLNPNRIVDVRYSLIPNRLDGMWGIVLDPQAGASSHVEFATSRPEGEALRNQTNQLWSMILGR